MGRQGKMANMPFHIETIRYMKAVEHFNDPEVFNDYSFCKYLDKTTNQCTLWNSGFYQCNGPKCKYSNIFLRRKNTCKDCKFYNSENRSVICQIQNDIRDIRTGEYCCLFDYIIYINTNQELTVFSEAEIKNLIIKSVKTNIHGKKWYIAGKPLTIERNTIIDLINCMNGKIVNNVLSAEYVVRSNERRTIRTIDARKLISMKGRVVLMDENVFVKMINSILSS